MTSVRRNPVPRDARVPSAMTPLERTTLTFSTPGREPVPRPSPGGCPPPCPGGCARWEPGGRPGPAVGDCALPDGPAAARSRPCGRPVTSAAVCPARGGGVVIVLLGWLTLVRGPRTDATGFITSRCRIAWAGHGIKLFRLRAAGPVLWPAPADRPGRGGEHEHYEGDAYDDDRQGAEV